jgi:hypothetical protein
LIDEDSNDGAAPPSEDLLDDFSCCADQGIEEILANVMEGAGDAASASLMGGDSGGSVAAPEARKHRASVPSMGWARSALGS